VTLSGRRDRFRDRLAPGDNAVVAADQMIADRPFSLVLTGVDGSERASEAARQAALLASAVRAQLIVAYVIEDRPYEEGDAERALEAASAARPAGADPEARIRPATPATPSSRRPNATASISCASGRTRGCSAARSGSVTSPGRSCAMPHARS
jgi:hypothetical protein